MTATTTRTRKSKKNAEVMQVNLDENHPSIIDTLRQTSTMQELADKLAGDEPFTWNLTPEQAETLLTLCNTFNRVPSPAKVKNYVAAMVRKEWQYNNATIGFYKDGRICDGQHRMQACAAAKVDIKTVIVPGLDPKCFKTIDLGKGRTPRDAFQMEGHQNPGIKASACILALKWMLFKQLRNVATPTTSQVLKYEQGQRQAIREICGWAVSLHDTYGQLIHPGYVAGAVLIHYMKNMKLDKDLLDFVEEVWSGRATENQTAAYHLRKLIEGHVAGKTLKTGKLTQEGLVGSVLKAYKVHKTNKPAHNTKDIVYPARKNEKFGVCL